MKIFLRCPSAPKDWCIVELQGEVSIDGLPEEFNPDGLQFADITEQNVRMRHMATLCDAPIQFEANYLRQNRQGKAILKIGQHELRGTSTKLEKPLAVLKKVTSECNPSSEMDTDISSTDISGNTSYEIVGVVRQKFLFKDRPKVLLDLTSK